MTNTLISKEKTTKENRVWVRIASACNNKCIFCLDENAQDGTLVDEQIVRENIKKWFQEWKYNRIIISWGEASINPKFSEYIEYAKRLWYDKVQTITNGNMFFHESFCKKVFHAWLDEVTFSFHGHCSDLHDYLVDTPWAFKKSLKGLIYVKKFFPHIIVNIDVVVNKVNVNFLPDIVKFFMKLWVYEYDLLHIIPFGRGFDKYEKVLFYDVKDYLKPLQATWKLSKTPWMCLWTNRFPVEAFEGYEDLIQDPRKIRSEVTQEWYEMYSWFIESHGEKKPKCFGASCKHCFIRQYCHDFLKKREQKVSPQDVVNISPDITDYSNIGKKYVSLEWELFVSDIYKKYWPQPENFITFLSDLSVSSSQEFTNIPICLRSDSNTWRYQYYPDLKYKNDSFSEYTDSYIKNLYRKKGLRCRKCKYYDTCEGIHINYIRAYGFKILRVIT